MWPSGSWLAAFGRLENPPCAAPSVTSRPVAKPSSNLRLFVAIHPPPEVSASMLAALQSIVVPPNRPAAVEQVHMTLQFIGDTPAAHLDDVIESVNQSAAGLGPFELRPQRL